MKIKYAILKENNCFYDGNVYSKGVKNISDAFFLDNETECREQLFDGEKIIRVKLEYVIDGSYEN